MTVRAMRLRSQAVAAKLGDAEHNFWQFAKRSQTRIQGGRCRTLVKHSKLLIGTPEGLHPWSYRELEIDNKLQKLKCSL